MTIIDEMRSAGFDDDTIGSWANEQKPAMKQAGFDDDTIEGYFSGLKQPGSIPRPFLKRASAWLNSSSISDAVTEGAKAGFGEEPLGPSPEDTAKLRDMGVYDNGTGNAALRGLRMANEAVIPAAATAAEGMLRGFNGVLMGIGAGIGQVASEATGGNEAEQARARRDTAQMVTIGALLAGTVSPVSRAPKAPGLPDEVIGHLPVAQDFTAAAKIVANEHRGIEAAAAPEAIKPELPLNDGRATVAEPWDSVVARAQAERAAEAENLRRYALGEPQVSAPVSSSRIPIEPTEAPTEAEPDHVPPLARQKIVSLYEDHGIHPAEIAADVKSDPEIARAIMSPDPKELPKAYVEAYHGSPHDFEAFDSSKIGTGEGAQSYGHGLYFAEKEGVARGYQKNVTNKALIDKARELYDEYESPAEATRLMMEDADLAPAQKRLVEALQKDDWLGFDYPHQAISAAFEKGAAERYDLAPETVQAIKEASQLYKVKIKADTEHFLDWDKPLSEQPANAQALIKELMQLRFPRSDPAAFETVGDIYKKLEKFGSPKSVAKEFAEAGIPGIKYLDQGSRAKGEGTRNLVVFDDKHIEITHKNGEAVASAFKAAEAITTGTKPIPQYSPDIVVKPAGKLQTAGYYMFKADELNVDAKRFQFKSDGDAHGVNKALSGVTQWDTSKSGGIIVWEQKDGQKFVADGHQRSGLARRLMAEGHAPIDIPGVLYREVDGVKAEDARAIAAAANIANGSGSALDGAKVLRSRPELIDGSIPLSTGKGKQAVALSKLDDEAFGLVVNEVVPENYGAIVGELIPKDGARQVAALKAIARFEPRNVDEAAALVNRVKAAELAKADQGAQGSMFGDLETAESTAGEEMKIVGRAIADLKKDKTLFGRVVANAERIEQTGSKIEQENAKSVATDAEKFARILASDAYSAGPIRTVLVAAAKDLKNGHETIGESAARVVAALRGETENAVANRDGAGGGAKSAKGAEGGGDGSGAKPAEPAPGTYHKPIEEAGATEPGADGKPQGLIPGVEPVKPLSVKEQLLAAAEQPMTGGDKPADGLFGNSMNEPQLFDKPRDIFSDAAARAEGQDILDGAEGGKPKGLGADAVDPYEENPRGALPAGTLVSALRDVANRATGIWHDIQMATVPMAVGTDVTMAMAKDFANALRRVTYEWSRNDDMLVKNFSREDRARMWSASDEESVALQLGESREHQGLVTLTDRMRAVVEALQTRAQAVWVQARDLGMVEGESLPSYTPRMLINIATGDGEGARALNAIGTNLKTTSNRLKRRAHMMDYETERAGKDRFGEQVELARDIRALPLATADLERAVAGRQMIENIKEVGKRAGTETVVEGAKPGDGWFTIDHPAFKTWRPKLEKVSVTDLLGEREKYQAVKDAEGNVIFEQAPLFVHGDFEGPLRAVLGQRSSKFYSAAMELKGKTMSVIMTSPLIHNAVEFGRAFPTMPGKMITFRVYRDGGRAIADIKTMREAIDHGLVPIGHRAFNQDITSMMESPNLKAGRSITSNVLAYVPGLFDPAAGLAVKETIDKFGNFYHNKMLWDQVAKLQAGLYVNLRDTMTTKGIDGETAQYLAAHMANRYAGALPKEAMSHNATAIANSLLFSRSFTMGNLGVMKDMLNGAPRDVMAQIERDVGSIDPKATDYARNLARRKAFAVIVNDMVLMWVANSLFQSVLNMVSGRKDPSEEGWGYIDRMQKLMQRVSDDPRTVLHPLAMAESLTPMSENEPGKRDRIFAGHTKDGTAVYLRNPIGKIGEEFMSWFSSPLEMLRKKEGTIFRPLFQTFANDKGFGRHVYNPYAEDYDDIVKNAAAIAWHIAKAQTPEGQINAAIDLATGHGDATLNAAQAIGPLLGITASRGAPGGPAMGELYAQQAQQRFRVNAKLPEWRQQIQEGHALAVIGEMTQMGVAKGLQQFYLRTSLNPAARMTGRAMKDFYLSATPEQRARMEDTLKRMHEAQQ